MHCIILGCSSPVACKTGYYFSLCADSFPSFCSYCVSDVQVGFPVCGEPDLGVDAPKQQHIAAGLPLCAQISHFADDIQERW